jgi:hypothetical protein
MIISGTVRVGVAAQIVVVDAIHERAAAFDKHYGGGNAGLRPFSYTWWGYAMTADVQSIAIEALRMS